MRHHLTAMRLATTATARLMVIEVCTRPRHITTVVMAVATEVMVLTALIVLITVTGAVIVAVFIDVADIGSSKR